MERRFDMTNFEQSLKEQADDLIMIPTKRVWNGIYNNLHPGSKWPSAAMGFLFLFTFLGIGHLNNNRHAATVSMAEVNSDESSLPFEETSSAKMPSNFQGNLEEKSLSKSAVNTNIKSGARVNRLSKSNENSTGSFNKIAKVVPLYARSGKTNEPQTNNFQRKFDNGKEASEIILQKTTDEKVKSEENIEGSNLEIKARVVANSLSIESPEFSLQEFEGLDILSANKELEANNVGIDLQENQIALAEINKIEAQTQKPITKKRKESVKWSLYLTPGFSNASFVNQIPQSPNSNASSLILRRNQQPYGMIRNSRFGYEIGTEMSYVLWKKLQLISGLNFSNSGYRVVSNQVHPTLAKLNLLQEPSGMIYTQNYITHYGNGQSQNQVSLPNYRVQISVPIGLKQALLENDKIRIDLASSIEPSYILKSQAFLISSDGRYYVEDPDLLRKMNLSGKFGTYITFKSQRIKWQLGPTLRYQLLSTYQKKYPVKEHLFDYGIRIGISK